MAQQNDYPKTLEHPCGFKTLTVYNAQEEMARQQEFQAFRAENARAQQAAMRGEAFAVPAKGASR